MPEEFEQADMPGVSDVHTALERLLREVAVTLSLPIGMEGEAFVTPLDTHLRGKVTVEKVNAASLGPEALTRMDGVLEVTVTTRAGLGQATAMAVAQTLSTAMPRGMRLDLPGGGEITLRSTVLDAPGARADRYRVTLRNAFYAFVLVQ